MLTNHISDEWEPVWTPDSRSLYYRAAIDNQIYKVDVDDGRTVVTVAQDLEEPTTAITELALSADGQFLSFVTGNGDRKSIYILSTVTNVVYDLNLKAGSHKSPQFAPNR